MFAPHGFHRVGQIFSGKGEKRKMGEKGRQKQEDREHAMYFHRAERILFCKQRLHPLCRGQRDWKSSCRIRLRLGTVFQFKQKPRWYSNIQPDFGAIFRCILVINQMPTPLPLWHITNTVQVAPQYKFTFNTTESIHVSNRSRLSSKNNTMSYKTLLFT